ncbi:hypothetical protein BDW59DRAFT_163993 [Aspergillus cavernicola]|uniref:DUF6536 domain-containing protein n=1 Tax=Aspergillus cavernicola TaxID=176166 RepID=A0ABR4I239_9EURO
MKQVPGLGSVAIAVCSLDSPVEQSPTNRGGKVCEMHMQRRSRLMDTVDDDLGDGASCEEASVDSPAAEAQVSTTPWIKGVYICAMSGVVVLFTNFVLVCIAAGFASKYPENVGISSAEVIYKGSCDIVQRWDVAVHLLINILSTTILAASNYCMQTLVAPSREEVDRRHGRNQWLDIGIPSFRNLSAIEPFRRCSWIVLLVTATPFHLMYNSAIFKSRATREYSVLIGPADMDLDNVSNLATTNLGQCFTTVAGLSWEEFTSDTTDGNYERLDRGQCKEFLDRGYPSNTQALMVLTDKLSADQGGDQSILKAPLTGGRPDNYDQGAGFSDLDSLVGKPLTAVEITLSAPGPNGTMYYDINNFTYADVSCWDMVKDETAVCSDIQRIFQLMPSDRYWSVQQVQEYIKTNTTSDVEISTETVQCTDLLRWISFDFPVQPVGPLTECLRFPAEERCRLNYSPPICIVVCLSGFMKVVTMFLAARLHGRRRSPPFLTVGDAVASFLTRPDPTTKGMCLMSNVDARRIESFRDEAEFRRLSKPRLWVSATSPLRWIMTLILCLTTIGPAGFLLNMAAVGFQYNPMGQPSNIASWWRLGFGVANRSFSVNPLTGAPVLAAVVVSNSPQLLVTVSYYFYNNILTCMLAAAEYSAYGIKRQPLRVSWPAKDSQQRSTYWLSMPYKYAIPLLAMYATLHWLISQSLFYYEFVPYDLYGNPRVHETSLGYSPIAILFAIIVGGSMMLLLLGLSLRRLPSRMPLAGSCSLAISAACHPPKGEDLKTVTLGTVMWGETTDFPEGMYQDASELELEMVERAHCSFAALDSAKPILTKWYA